MRARAPSVGINKQYYKRALQQLDLALELIDKLSHDDSNTFLADQLDHDIDNKNLPLLAEVDVIFGELPRDLDHL